jgi:4-alpha-glucanotransferase
MAAIPKWMQGLPSARHWEKVGADPHAGICVPLVSLRSERGMGIGDVGDLYALIDWCARIGCSVIQLLPLNDTGLDACPYSAISAYANDPIFIALDQLEALDGVAIDPTLAAKIREAAARLNASPRIDNGEVRQTKLALLREAWASTSAHDTEGTLRDGIAAFRGEQSWLADYTLYRVLKEHHGWGSWEDWGPSYANEAALEGARREHQEGIQFHEWCQFVLDTQLREVKHAAGAQGIRMMGDIPILIGRDSADVWRQGHLFQLDKVAGAPPDMYAEDGQNWGFPTYNWDAMAAEDYRWWRERLRFAERSFDLYRIDHIVGFFRIWTISHGEETGRNGAFEPRDERRWGEHGWRLLSMMLESSAMLPMGEDLGTIPHVCRDTMRDLGICGMKVDRWERRWEQDGGHIDPRDFDPLSLATLSTHDSETAAGWWADRRYREDVQLLYNSLGHEGGAPETLSTDLQEQLLRRISSAGSIFVLHLIQELLYPFGLLPGGPEDHRINTPGTVGPHNWTWRMPLTLDALLDDHARNERIAELIKRP